MVGFIVVLCSFLFGRPFISLKVKRVVKIKFNKSMALCVEIKLDHPVLRAYGTVCFG